MSHSHDLTSGGIRDNIRRLAVPAAVGFFCHTLYNMTDTFYAGFISTAAQAALAFSFPLFFIVLSCCVGIGQALTARTANALGKRRLARGAYFVGQGLVMATVVSVFIWLVLLPATAALVAAMGGRGEAAQWATDYSRIIYIGTPLFLFTFLLNAALQAVGNTKAFRNSIIASVLLNIVLDPILMFGWFGLPALGVSGIALATLLSQLFGGLYMLGVFSRTIIAKRWRWVFMRPRLPILLTLIKQSLAPTIRMLGIGLFFFLVTAFLSRLDNNAVAAYGIALRIEQMFLLPTIGLEVALLAYAGQNLASGKKRQTRSAYYLCVRYGLICMAFSALVELTCGRFLISLFNDDAEVIRYGYGYLIAAACVGPLYLFINTGGAIVMAALRSLDIALVSILRLLLLPMFFFWLLAFELGWGVTGIWVGIILANSVAAWWMHHRGVQLFS